jgi:hypothetical protein
MRSHLVLAKRKKNRSLLRRVVAVRRIVEAAAIEHRGQLGVYEDAQINTFCEWELFKADIHRYLEDHGAELTPEQWLAFRREIPKASSARVTALKDLGLDVSKDSNVWDCLNEPLPALTSAPPATNGHATPQPATSTPAKPSGDVAGVHPDYLADEATGT